MKKSITDSHLHCTTNGDLNRTRWNLAAFFINGFDRPLELTIISTVTSETHFYHLSAPWAHKNGKNPPKNYCLDSHFLRFPFDTVELGFTGPALIVTLPNEPIKTHHGFKPLHSARKIPHTHAHFTRNGSISGSGDDFLSKARWLFLAQIHGSGNLSQIREELLLFFIRLRPPLIVAAVFLVLCHSLCTMCWISFSYSFACISYPASTTHSHTHSYGHLYMHCYAQTLSPTKVYSFVQFFFFTLLCSAV